MVIEVKPENLVVPEFKPATIALMGTTDLSSPWRPPIIDALVELRVPSEEIYNPVKPADTWNPDIDGPLEDFQKKNAQLVIFYIGSSSEGTVSTYSAFELADLLGERDPDSIIVVANPVGLKEHPAKQLRAIKSNIRTSNPDTVVVDSIGKSLDSIVERLGLSVSLGEMALRHAIKDLDDKYANLRPDFSPERIRLDTIEALRPQVEQVTEAIKTAIRESHGIDCFYVNSWGAHAAYSPEHNTVAELVHEYFRGHGWVAYSDRDGGVVIARSKEDAKKNKEFITIS